MLQYLHLLSGMFLAASMVFYFGIAQRPALYIFFISYFAEYIVSQRWKQWRFDGSQYAFIAMVCFFLLIPIYHLFEATDTYFFKQLEMRMAFGGIGILGILGSNKNFKIDFIGITFAAVSVILCIFLLIKTLSVTGFHTDLESFVTTCSKIRIDYINNHMIFNQYLCISFCFLCYFLIKYKKTYNYILCLTAAVIIYATIFLSEGRAGFISLHLIIVSFLTYQMFRWKKSAGIIASVSLLAAMIFVMSTHYRMDSESLKNNPRFMIWHPAIELIKEKPLLGYGVSDGSEKYIDKCLEEGPYFFIYIPQENPQKGWAGRNIIGAHAHNVFLQTLMEFGILGLLIFISIFVFSIRSTKGKERVLLLLFYIGWICQGMFESLGSGLYPLTFCFVIYSIAAPRYSSDKNPDSTPNSFASQKTGHN